MTDPRLPFSPAAAAAALSRLLDRRPQSEVVRRSGGALDKSTVSRMLAGKGRLSLENIDAFLRAIGADYRAFELALQPEKEPGRALSPDPLLQLVADLVRRVGALEVEVSALRELGLRGPRVEAEVPADRKA